MAQQLCRKESLRQACGCFFSYRFRALDPIVLVRVRVLERFPKGFGDGLVAPYEQAPPCVFSLPAHAPVSGAFGARKLLRVNGCIRACVCMGVRECYGKKGPRERERKQNNVNYHELVHSEVKKRESTRQKSRRKEV